MYHANTAVTVIKNYVNVIAVSYFDITIALLRDKDYKSRVERKTGVSQMVVFPQT